MALIYTSADQLIGKTPLLELTPWKRPGAEGSCDGEAGALKSCGAVKDRVAKAMIHDAKGRWKALCRMC